MKKIFFYLSCVLLLFSCSENNLDENINTRENSCNPSANVQLSLNQAVAYANIFSQRFKELEEQGNKRLETRSSTSKKLSIKNVDFIVEGIDTLLYVINFSNDNGYMLLSGANSSFPVIAHSSTGNLYLKDIDKANPLYMVVESYKNKIKKELSNPSLTSNEYFEEWKDLGKKGYEYEIEPNNTEPKPATRTRRKDSTGKKTIYPYTGKQLDYWCQEGGYNFYAQNQYPIGCPAIATGMLMYDTSQRILGNSQTTFPLFNLTDTIDVKDINKGTSVAKKLRLITDSIPEYNFTPEFSGALPDNITIGLHKLGYTKAEKVPYNFELLYKNLTFKGYDYFGQETDYQRGILLAAYQSAWGGGHIWFCDGYYEQAYTIKKKFLGIRIKSWEEYDDRIYMNWGWGHDKGNGWYCATDSQWSSLDKENINLNYETFMYINLNHYEIPIHKNNH